MPSPQQWRRIHGFRTRLALVPCLLMAIVAGPLLSLAQEQENPKKTPPQPEQKLLPKLEVVDFVKSWGTVLQGESKRLRYRLKNSGAGVLVIHEVSPSVGALKATFTPKVAPGGEGYIDIVIDGNGLARRQGADQRDYTARITCNDPNNPSNVINISGKFQRILSWNPGRLKLQNIAGSPLSLDVELAAAEGVSLELHDVRSKFLKADVSKPEKVSSGMWKFKLASPARKTIGFEQDELIVDLTARLSADDSRKLSLPIELIIQHQPRIEVSPEHGIRFSRDETDRLRDDPPHNHVESIQVHALDPAVKFQVTKVDIHGIPEGMFSVDIEEIDKDKRFEIHVEIHQPASRRVRGTIKIYTNDPSQGLFERHLLAQFTKKR